MSVATHELVLRLPLLPDNNNAFSGLGSAIEEEGEAHMQQSTSTSKMISCSKPLEDVTCQF